jgi:dTDP-glucose 4,6-dehydratase
MVKVLITGGSGFIGHHVIEHLIKNTDWKIINIDKLSYSSGGFDRLRDIECYNTERVVSFSADLTLPLSDGIKREIGEVDYILHLAAESHVDNSITDPVKFMQNNINSTIYLLEYARELKDLKKFLYFSTDEVYGTAPEGMNYKEGDRFNPGNPYSASKASSEAICYAYSNTFKLPIIITNTMNVIGERQHCEKFIPKIINHVLDDKIMPIHSNSAKTKAGTRFYIHARNVADGILFILTKTDETLNNIDASKGKFNIVGELELDNKELAHLVAYFLGKQLKYELVDFHSSRPGHDLRYALDGSKMSKLGWKVSVGFTESLRKVIEWSLMESHRKWLGRVN